MMLEKIKAKERFCGKLWKREKKEICLFGYGSVYHQMRNEA